MKLTTNFDLQEFVSPEAYNIHGDDLVNALNPQLAPTAQAIKDKASAEFGQVAYVICNDWLWEFVPTYTKSGLRDAAMAGDFRATYSWHFYGCAMDLKFKVRTESGVQLLDRKGVFEMIMSRPDEFPYITRLEHPDATPTWLHVEVGNKPRNGKIKVFRP